MTPPGTPANTPWKSATPTGAGTNGQIVKIDPTEMASGKLPTQGNMSPLVSRGLKDLEDRTKAQITEIEKFQFAFDKKKQKLDQGLTGVGKVAVTPSQPLQQGAVLNNSTSPNSSSVTSYNIQNPTETKNSLIDASKKLNDSLTKLRSILKQAETTTDQKSVDQEIKELDIELKKIVIAE
ncbi:MAG: hypothetical protein ACRYGR_03515 [Janthinobacterium lividum]